MNIGQFIKRNDGFSTTIFLLAFGAISSGLIILYTFFTIYMSEIEAFKADASVDCFLANRSAIVQLKNEYSKVGYTGEFQIDKCKDILRGCLESTFNVKSTGDDLLLANENNNFIKQVEIKEYLLNENNEIDYTVYITARPYFDIAFFGAATYKIRSTISIDQFKA